MNAYVEVKTDSSARSTMNANMVVKVVQIRAFRSLLVSSFATKLLFLFTYIIWYHMLALVAC